jgi:hypothetical protein
MHKNPLAFVSDEEMQFRRHQKEANSFSGSFLLGIQMPWRVSILQICKHKAGQEIVCNAMKHGGASIHFFQQRIDAHYESGQSIIHPNKEIQSWNANDIPRLSILTKNIKTSVDGTY